MVRSAAAAAVAGVVRLLRPSSLLGRHVPVAYAVPPLQGSGVARPLSNAATPYRDIEDLVIEARRKLANRAPWSLNFCRGSAFASGYSALTRKTLDSIMKIEKVQHASPDELTGIWNEYHIGRGHISAVMGRQLFDAFEQRARACPNFVIPVRRGYGYITLLVQAQMPYMLFTGLEDFKRRGSDATPYLTVTHYTEFAETKGLVLVRGDVVLTSKLSDVEAKTALEVAHAFYLDNSRYRIVTKFNKKSDEFDFKEVLRELNISLGP